LSQRKAEYLSDLARHFASGKLDPKRWRKLDDESVIAQLIDVKGIGRWTAEMFLMFHELRPDVLPVDDLGLQKAMARLFLKDARPTRDAMLALAEPWRPWRSVATWYLWRSLEPVPVDY
jgi:DNA-3-methyladenine glycosylase II